MKKAIYASSLFALGILTFMAGAFVAPSFAVAAREAAFIDPAVSNANNVGADAIAVEPKGEIDVGESSINIARRVVLFFVNRTGAPIEIESMAVNGDGNVVSAIVSDDCSKEGKIEGNSRCSVIVSITPTSSGPWAAEALLTHKGVGRIARAKITGKSAAVQSSTERKDTGFAPTNKEQPPINFGDVDAGAGRAVRSALMVNDSPDPLTIFSIDLIAPENGLARLNQGCAVDMDLKPGESCPITLEWKPATKGAVSTDLIVRHSGKMGFVVIPVRGNAKEDATTVAVAKAASGGGGAKSGDKIPMPPTADELEQMAAGKIPPVALEIPEGSAAEQVRTPKSTGLHLIGTVGSRAILVKPDGTTAVVGVGEEIRLDDDKTVRVTSVLPQSAEVLIGDQKKKLNLQAAESVTSKGEARYHELGNFSSSSSRRATSFSSKKGTEKEKGKSSDLGSSQ